MICSMSTSYREGESGYNFCYFFLPQLILLPFSLHSPMELHSKMISYLGSKWTCREETLLSSVIVHFPFLCVIFPLGVNLSKGL